MSAHHFAIVSNAVRAARRLSNYINGPISQKEYDCLFRRIVAIVSGIQIGLLIYFFMRLFGVIG